MYSRPKQEQLGAYINASTGERLDFEEVKTLATALSTVLIRAYALQPGDAVSLFSTNTIWYPVAMWAIVRAGGCVNGASPSYGVDEMVNALKTAGTKVLFTLPASLDVALQAASKVGLGKERVILLEGEVDGVKSLHDLVLEARWCDPVDAWTIPEDKTNRDICGYGSWSCALL